MSTTRIVAEAIIKGIDETGGAFKSVQGKIDALVKKFGQVGKAAAISGQIDKLNTSLKKTQDQLAGVQKLQSAEERLSRLGARYAEQKARAEEQANARTAASAQRAAASYYKQLDATNALRRNLEGAGLAVNQLASEEARLRGAIDGTSAAIARQNRALAQAALKEEQIAGRRSRIQHGVRETGRHLLGSTLGLAGGVGAGYAAIRGAEIAAEKAGEYEGALNRVRNVSNSEDEVRLAGALASKAAAANPYTTRTQSIEDYVELRSLAVSNKPGEAINREAIERNVLLMAKARAALASSGYQLEGGEGKALAQALEGSGRAMDPRAQEKMLDAYVRAKQVFGNAIQASDVRSFVQNAKSANFSISDESFFNTVMARLAQGNSSRLGNEFSQTMQTIVGGHMTKAGAEWLAKTGMIDPGQIRKGGGGKFFIAGKIKEQDLLSTDVTAWAQQVLYPGIEKAGGVSKKEIEGRVEMLRKEELRANPKAQIDEHTIEERAVHGLVADFIAKSGFRTTVTDNLAHAIANAFQTQKDVEQMHAAKGLGAANTIGQNPVAAFGELGSSISSLVAAAGSPTASAAATLMHSLAGGISALAAAAAEHPNLSTGALAGAGLVGLGVAGGGAYLTYQWLAAGTHLSASAVALDGSAAALTEAAAVMSGKGVIPGGGAAPAGAAEVAKTGGSIWSRVLSQGLPMFGIGSLLGEEIRANPDKYPHLQPGYMPDSVRAMIDGKSGESVGGARPGVRMDGGAGPGTLAMLADRDAEDRSYGSSFSLTAAASRRTQYVPTPGGGFGSGLGVPHSEIDLGPNIRAALEGLKATVEQPVPVDVTGKVESELKGSADVRVSISVSGDGRVTSEHASSSGNIRASVSTGTSMRSLAPGSPPPDT